MRHWPTASKFSSEKPSGSITLWHAAQAGFLRCSSMRSRTVVDLAAFIAFLQRGHVGRRRGRRSSHNVLEDPFAAQHRRGPRRVRRDSEDAALPQQPGALPIAGESDAAELAAVHVRDAVVLRQPLVEEGVIGGQQIDARCGLRGSCCRRTFPSRCGTPRAGFRRSSGSPRSGRIDALQVTQEEPLAGEVRDQRLRFRVRQHAPDLLLQDDGIFEFALRRHIQQFVVRDAAPEEERQARSQFEIADAIDAARLGVWRVGFDAVQELGIGQDEAAAPVSMPASKLPLLRPF